MKKINLFLFSVVLTTISFGQGIEFSEILNWTGTGDNIAMLIIDFNDSADVECYAFGYRFDGEKTAENMIVDIAENNPLLSVNIGSGFLNDVIYNSQEGVGGSPYYWSSFNFVDTVWISNLGISEAINDSSIFGFSYTDFDMVEFLPINKPENPIPATSTANINKFNNLHLKLYPNPTSNFFTIESEIYIDKYEIYDIKGNLISNNHNIMSNIINVENLKTGLYLIKIISKEKTYTSFFNKI